MNIYLMQKNQFLPVSSTKESDVDFPWFEDQNITGRLVRYEAHLHKHGAHVVFKRPRHSDLDVRFFNNDLDEYDCLNNIDFSNRMKVCRQNPKVKTSPNREFNAAFELLR